MIFELLAQDTQPPESKLPTYMMLGGVILLLMFAMSALRRRSAKRPEPIESSADRNARLSRTHEKTNEIRSMMVELEDLTRRFSAQLDAKSMRLEQLIHDADQRIHSLQQLEGAASAPKSPGPDAAKRAAAKLESLSTKVDSGAPQARKPFSSAGLPNADPLTAKVCELADAGQSAKEIASQLQEHVGKVELILAIRRSRNLTAGNS